MKKVLTLVMAITMSASIFAAKIAVVDTQQVFAGYSKTQTVRTKLETEKVKLEGQLEIKAKSLDAMAQELNAKGDKVTVVETDKFQKQKVEFENEYQALQEKLGRMEYEEMNEIQSDVKSAVNQVAKKDKYDLVIEKGAVLYGGQDITSEVSKTLESSKKIKL